MKFFNIALLAMASFAAAAPAPEADADVVNLSDLTELIKTGEAKVVLENVAAEDCQYRCCNNWGLCRCC
ncbi:hypothetical protein FDECE_10683 [Fusarium decemcellulare]|nr:hypothetical protein FDECE_10683 [Fusarium decemcellulare]